MKKSIFNVICTIVIVIPSIAQADEGPARTGPRITQQEIVDGAVTLTEIRAAGLGIFATPFNKQDGYGDGPVGSTAEDRTIPGKRTSLQANGTFTRVNGLDAQTCFECHSVVSRATVPMTFGIGGTGGLNNTVLGAIGASFVDANDSDHPAKQNIDGRIINPPFVFGSGGVELLAKEMTRDLQSLAASAQSAPNTPVQLSTKGVYFGRIIFTNGQFDTTQVIGINADPDSPNFLVVQPFGRKGDNKTTRTFDSGAIRFHMGMQPVEFLNEFPLLDDNDGVDNEISIGEMSALSIFQATLERPKQDKLNKEASNGQLWFNAIGCTACHVPKLETDSKKLPFSFPEIARDPDANVYFEVDLSNSPTSFEGNDQGGVTVELFADLKRHYMGSELEEFDNDGVFTTARLWGLADTAPYLHDGRALTITDAIIIHGGIGSEAASAVNEFKKLSTKNQDDVITFLKTLRTPTNPAADLVGGSRPRK